MSCCHGLEYRGTSSGDTIDDMDRYTSKYLSSLFVV